MDDLISRQAVIDALWRVNNYGSIYDTSAIFDAIDAVKALPSVQPVPKKGEWLPDNNNYFAPYFVCSHCHSSYRVDTVMNKPTWKHCPNCGVCMKGEQDE